MAENSRLIKSTGSPEGFIEAPVGTFFINTQSYALYVKIRGDVTTKTGWVGLICKGFYDNHGNPEDIVMAPRMAYCLDVDDNVLYVQTTDSVSPIAQGWISLTQGTIVTSIGSPITTEATGDTGDIYIDTESGTIHVKTDEGWMTLSQLSVNSADILLDLSELLSNVTDIANSYFNLFINPEPMDVTITAYDKSGILNTYNIPNRAKDRQISMGNFNPNDNLASAIGTFYMDNSTRSLYLKTTDLSENTGWKPVIYGGKLQEPLYINSEGKLALRTDITPDPQSDNMISSRDLHNLFDLKADKEGDENINFKVAYPTEAKDAVNLEFIQNMFSYDSATRTLKIRTELNNG